MPFGRLIRPGTEAGTAPPGPVRCQDTGDPDRDPEQVPERCAGARNRPLIRMAEDLSDSVSGSTELIFPDDGRGTYRLEERTVYGAEEVRSELNGDVPQYGSWLPVTDDSGDEAWLCAPSKLRAVLVEDDIQTGERFRIETMRKSGTKQSDPYRVEVTYPDRDGTGKQTGLSDA